MELKGKKLLILAGASLHIKIVKAAKELGVYTIVTDNLKPEDSPAKLIADEFWMNNIFDIDNIVQRCKEEKVDGVITFCIDPTQIPYQRICEKLNLPCYGTKEQFRIFTNKQLFKDFCKKYNVNVIPEYSRNDIINNNVNYPVLVKPTDSRGSRGINICYNQEEVLNAMNIASNESLDKGVIIEQYFNDAHDMSFAYMVVNKIPYLVKIGDRILGDKKDNLQCQQMAAILPSKYKQQYIELVEPNVKEMIKGLGLEFGAVFLQGFWKGNKVYMYDPGLRFPGTDFDVVTKEVTGFDAMKSFVRFALTGDINSCYGDINLAYNYNDKFCLILSVSIKAGVIDIIEGIEEIVKHPYVIDYYQRYHKGDVISNYGDIRQRVLEFVMYIPNYNEIKNFIDFVYKTLKIIDTQGNDMIVSRVVLN
jgi:biotin carboxylase